MADNNWVKIYRSVFDSDMWLSEKFSRSHAWIDLILLANWKPSSFYKRGVLVEVNRGQVSRSKKELADRWKWSTTKVSRFIHDLEKDRQIEHQINNVTTLITIVNYNDYQDEVNQKNTRSKPEVNQKNTLKKDQESEEGKEQLGLRPCLTEKSIFDQWNKLASSVVGLKECQTLTSSRSSKISTRLKSSDWSKVFTEALGKLPLGSKGNWQPPFNWMIHNESNVHKIVDGEYDWMIGDSQTQSKPTKLDSDTQAKVDFVAGELNTDPWAYLAEAFTRSSSGEFQECLIIQAMDQTQTKDLDNPQAYFRAVLEGKIKDTL